MGLVYLAVALGPAGVQKLVVIKQLRDSLASSADIRGMFLDEARVAMRLNHPNVVQTNEVVDEGPDLYLVMEFLDGQPLAALLEPEHAANLPLAARLRILCDALTGLQYAHELSDLDGTLLNIVHRDVSPHNIMVTYEGQVKIVDFGIAKAADATTVTDSGVFKGKVRYTSPEQALCTPIDRRADVFGMGIILWECARRPSSVEGRQRRVDPHRHRLGEDPRSARGQPRRAAGARCNLQESALGRSERPLRDGERDAERHPRVLPDTERRDRARRRRHRRFRERPKRTSRGRRYADQADAREVETEADTMRPIPVFVTGSTIAPSEGTGMARGGLAVETTWTKPPRSTKAVALAAVGARRPRRRRRLWR